MDSICLVSFFYVKDRKRFTIKENSLQNGDSSSGATTYRPNFSDEDVRDMVEVGIISRELGEKLSRAKVRSSQSSYLILPYHEGGGAGPGSRGCCRESK